MTRMTRRCLLLVSLALLALPACRSEKPQTSGSAGGGGGGAEAPAAATTPAETTPAEAAEAAEAADAAPDGDASAAPSAAAVAAPEVVPLRHASLVLRWGELAIHVDPVTEAYTAAGEVAAAAPKADLVLVTDLHGDHLDPGQIAAVRKDGAPVVAPAASAADIPEPTVLANGESLTLLGDVQITAVPMYNLERKRPDSGEPFHVPGRGNGYLLTRGETTVYIAGDTECTPEMKALTGVDLAFVPMNLPYTMPLDEAAACVRAFRPAVVYPYHHRGQDPAAFAAALADLPEVEVRVLDWYPEVEAITGEATPPPAQ